MKVILDTNVLISGIFFSGIPGKILDLLAENQIHLYVSPKIIDEYYRVGRILQEKYPDVKANQVIEVVLRSSQVIKENPTPDFHCDDPDDKMFVECALNSTCKLIVSGDKHLLSMTGFQGITVLKPRDFLDCFMNQKD